MEDFLTLYCDPGEDFGWAVGKDLTLLARGIEKMWPFAHQVWEKLGDPATDTETNPLSQAFACRSGVDTALMQLPIGRIVCEDWRIYPWEARKGTLDFDQCRTARVIGALTFMSQMFGIPLVLQGADIKDAARAAGAEELFDRPVHENRHSNDAIMHFVFFTNVELLGLDLQLSGGAAE